MGGNQRELEKCMEERRVQERGDEGGSVLEPEVDGGAGCCWWWNHDNGSRSRRSFKTGKAHLAGCYSKL